MQFEERNNTREGDGNNCLTPLNLEDASLDLEIWVSWCVWSLKKEEKKSMGMSKI